MEKVLELLNVVMQNSFNQSLLNVWWQLVEELILLEVMTGRVTD